MSYRSGKNECEQLESCINSTGTARGMGGGGAEGMEDGKSKRGPMTGVRGPHHQRTMVRDPGMG